MQDSGYYFSALLCIQASRTNPTTSHTFRDPQRDSQDNRATISHLIWQMNLPTTMLQNTAEISALKLTDFVKLDFRERNEERKQKRTKGIQEWKGHDQKHYLSVS